MQHLSRKSAQPGGGGRGLKGRTEGKANNTTPLAIENRGEAFRSIKPSKDEGVQVAAIGLVMLDYMHVAA